MLTPKQRQLSRRFTWRHKSEAKMWRNCCWTTKPRSTRLIQAVGRRWHGRKSGTTLRWLSSSWSTAGTSRSLFHYEQIIQNVTLDHHAGPLGPVAVWLCVDPKFQRPDVFVGHLRGQG